jgi:hypothetical protein
LLPSVTSFNPRCHPDKSAVDSILKPWDSFESGGKHHLDGTYHPYFTLGIISVITGPADPSDGEMPTGSQDFLVTKIWIDHRVPYAARIEPCEG